MTGFIAHVVKASLVVYGRNKPRPLPCSLIDNKRFGCRFVFVTTCRGGLLLIHFNIIANMGMKGKNISTCLKFSQDIVKYLNLGICKIATALFGN